MANTNGYSHFCSKNIKVSKNTLVTTVNKFVINKLVKLTILWTTGPSYLLIQVNTCKCLKWMWQYVQCRLHRKAKDFSNLFVYKYEYIIKWLFFNNCRKLHLILFEFRFKDHVNYISIKSSCPPESRWNKLIDCVGFNNTSTSVGYFVYSPRGGEKRYKR